MTIIDDFIAAHPGICSQRELCFLEQLLQIEFDPPTEKIAVYLVLGRERGDLFYGNSKRKLVRSSSCS